APLLNMLALAAMATLLSLARGSAEVAPPLLSLDDGVAVPLLEVTTGNAAATASAVSVASAHRWNIDCAFVALLALPGANFGLLFVLPSKPACCTSSSSTARAASDIADGCSSSL